MYLFSKSQYLCFYKILIYFKAITFYSSLKVEAIIQKLDAQNRYRAKGIFRKIRTELESLYHEEADMLTYILMDEYLNINRISCITDRVYVLENRQLSNLDHAVARLKNHEPIQYITGKACFYGREFFVGPGVLIPRQETEELIKLVKDKYTGDNSMIVDIGCGSGCIAVTLALEIPGAGVFALDKSRDSIFMSRKNADKFGVEILIFQYDIFMESWPFPTFDIFISNPPYVRESEKISMHPNILNYEPENALFVPDEDPIRYYRRIVELTAPGLKPGGLLFFEINEHFGAELTNLLISADFMQVEILRDIHGKDRLAFARKP
jgi:release factor glutamine methyltransferase